jgi:hypothetical protein
MLHIMFLKKLKLKIDYENLKPIMMVIKGIEKL